MARTHTVRRKVLGGVLGVALLAAPLTMLGVFPVSATTHGDCSITGLKPVANGDSTKITGRSSISCNSNHVLGLKTRIQFFDGTNWVTEKTSNGTSTRRGIGLNDSVTTACGRPTRTWRSVAVATVDGSGNITDTSNLTTAC